MKLFDIVINLHIIIVNQIIIFFAKCIFCYTFHLIIMSILYFARDNDVKREKS